MLNTPFSPWPSFTDEEAEAVKRVLLSNRVNYWTGEECLAFENEFAAWTGAAYAVALSNGTIALEAALKAMNIGPGDEVIVTPRTFLASASCILTVGAIPVFADVDRNSQNITAGTIRAALSPRTKAIICVHLAGMPCDMDPIMALAKEHGLNVIEDCAQAHGARYKNRSVGSIGHAAAWSFCQDKIMTTGGEGGMVTTNDEGIYEAVWSYKDHGKNRKACRRGPQAGFRWLHESLGTNGRMTEMQAVLGRIQLKRMKEWTARRTANAKAIEEACHGLKAVRTPSTPPDIVHAYYKYYVFVQPQHLADGWTRDRILETINARGVPCYQGSCSEVYREKVFEQSGWKPGTPLSVAKELGETSLMFLVHPTLTGDEIGKTCSVLRDVLEEAGKT